MPQLNLPQPIKNPIRKVDWLDQVLPSAVDILKPDGTMIISVMAECETKDGKSSLTLYGMTGD